MFVLVAALEVTNGSELVPKVCPNRSRWLSGRASASKSGGRGFDPRPRHTKGVKNGTSGYLAWCSAL